jgi:4-amino-4-deoxy-L-arabinose transferase-like glycosyltransferase
MQWRWPAALRNVEHMTATKVPAWRLGRQRLSFWAGPVLVGLVALLLRLYKLGRSPFWLDELGTYQISGQSPLAIIQYAWYDPWPPLYYLTVKLTSGFGLVHAEWAWRILSVVAGTLVVIGMYWLIHKLVSAGSAILTVLLIALSPTQLYFSQEARAHILVVLAVVGSTAVVYFLSAGVSAPAKLRPPWLWAAWVGLTIAGLYLGYSYAMVWLIQAAFLLWIARARRQAILAVGLTALAFLPLLFWIRANVFGQLASARQGLWLTLPILARMLLGGDPLRYGNNWGRVVLALILGSLILLGCLWVALHRTNRFGAYLVLQTVLPLIGFFGLADGLLQLHLQAYGARQFLVLLPASYALVALGLQLLASLRPIALGRLLGSALWACAAIACLPGLQSYWTLTKSPEGDLALAWRREAQPGDAVVSLHYSLDAALSFYAPEGIRVFSKPVVEAPSFAFSDSLSLLVTSQITHPYHLSNIRQSGRIWVLARDGFAQNVVAALESGCTLSATESFAPFKIIKLENCSSE